MTEEKGTERNKTDYKNGTIYKTLNHVTDEVYVGSTVRSLSKRMYEHKEVFHSNWTSYAIYSHMRESGCESFYIEFVEPYPCSTKEELRAKEGEWIRRVGTLEQQLKVCQWNHITMTITQHWSTNRKHIVKITTNRLKKRATRGGNKAEKRYYKAKRSITKTIKMQ